MVKMSLLIYQLKYLKTLEFAFEINDMRNNKDFVIIKQLILYSLKKTVL